MNKLILAFTVLGLLTACSTPSDKTESSAASKAPPSQAAAKKPQLAPAMTKPVDPLKDPNDILSKRSVYFDFDKYNIKEEYRILVEAHAKYLKMNPQRKVRIEGNADERGSVEYNLALGQRRAEAVRKMLIALGASDNQIEAVSNGEEKPKALGHDEAAYAENRRSDIFYNGE